MLNFCRLTNNLFSSALLYATILPEEGTECGLNDAWEITKPAY